MNRQRFEELSAESQNVVEALDLMIETVTEFLGDDELGGWTRDQYQADLVALNRVLVLFNDGYADCFGGAD